MVSPVSFNNAPVATSFSRQPQGQQQYPQYQQESKAKSYAKTAAKGFVMGAVVDALWQGLEYPLSKAFANKEKKVEIEVAKKAGQYKFKPERLVKWGVIWAAMGLVLRGLSSRDR